MKNIGDSFFEKDFMRTYSRFSKNILINICEALNIDGDELIQSKFDFETDINNKLKPFKYIEHKVRDEISK